jgi:hypothetical protein
MGLKVFPQRLQIDVRFSGLLTFSALHADVAGVQDMMTFGGIDEKIVTLEEARAEQEAELLQAECMQSDAGAGPAEPPVNDAAASAAAPSHAAAASLAASAVKTASAATAAGNGNGTSDTGAVTATTDSSGAHAPGGASATGAAGAAAKEEATGGTSNKKNNNTSVYVMGIPDDATEDEVAEEFARCGIIKQDADGNPRIKLYKHALSVSLAHASFLLPFVSLFCCCCCCWCWGASSRCEEAQAQ